MLQQPYDVDGLVVTRNGVLREEMMTVVLGWCGQVSELDPGKDS